MLSPMSNQLTLQIHHPHKGWVDCARLDLEQPEMGPKGGVTIRYLDAYATDAHQVASLGTLGWPAAWMQVPLELNQKARYKSWPVFFMDILPTGAAWEYWSTYFGLVGSSEEKYRAMTGLTKGVKEAIFLENTVIAPIGNLKIKESFSRKNTTWLADRLPFTLKRSQVAQLRRAFDSKLSAGMGAGGDALKVLLRLSQDQQIAWVDEETDIRSPDLFYLVKLARRSSRTAKPSERDQQILHAEYAYYQELNELGLDTLECSAMFVDESGEEPALWLPRFDRVWDAETKQWQVLGVESIAAAINQRGLLRHEAVLLALKSLHQHDPEAFQDQNFESQVLEWVRRDLLNVIFGNTDNHARNTSFLKGHQGIRLAPIYDFAPMAADISSIHRSIRWDKSIERGVEMQWAALPDHLAQLELADAEAVRKTLVETMTRCLGLYERLKARGVATEILEHPRIHLHKRDQQLKAELQEIGSR